MLCFLHGPIESKFGSKQFANKAFVEVSIKGHETPSQISNFKDEPLKVVREKRKLEADIKAIIESIVEITSYPK